MLREISQGDRCSRGKARLQQAYRPLGNRTQLACEAGGILVALSEGPGSRERPSRARPLRGLGFVFAFVTHSLRGGLLICRRLRRLEREVLIYDDQIQ
jgi:hypothetical protein